MSTSKGESTEECDTDDEELDPRIKLELEKLNAATDGINHLETEFGEAQALFQQMMQDATFQLKFTHQQLGKCVDKSRPYYEALIQAKMGHTQLHAAALAFEQAQTRHYNAKNRVRDAERKACSNQGRKLDPALQEVLNQSTIEVMEAAKLSQGAWDVHRSASIEFENKQKFVSDLYKSLHKNVTKSRAYFDLKMDLNKQLEVQKKRLEKIQEGLQLSKNEYSKTLHNLEEISDDIHKSRELKRAALMEPRGEGVGADSDNEEKIVHATTMERIRATTLDNVSDDLSFGDSVSTASGDDLLDEHNLDMDIKSYGGPEILINSLHIQVDEDMKESSYETSSSSHTVKNYSNLKVNIEKVVQDNEYEAYDVITSHSIPTSPPPPLDLLRDITDGVPLQRARSFGDINSCRNDYDTRKYSVNVDHLNYRSKSNSWSDSRTTNSVSRTTINNSGYMKNILVRVASLGMVNAKDS